MDDPEGNLVIVERVGHESQRHFPYWEHSWAGTAHVLNSTQQHATTTHHNQNQERKQNMKLEIDWAGMLKAAVKAVWAFIAGAVGGIFTGCTVGGIGPNFL
jgi:hypothetical protein